MNDIYSNVIEKSGGPYSLYCTSCKRWIPNTANAEMRKEGCIAHSHFCVNGVWYSTDDMSVADEKTDALKEEYYEAKNLAKT